MNAPVFGTKEATGGISESTVCDLDRFPNWPVCHASSLLYGQASRIPASGSTFTRVWDSTRPIPKAMNLRKPSHAGWRTGGCFFASSAIDNGRYTNTNICCGNGRIKPSIWICIGCRYLLLTGKTGRENAIMRNVQAGSQGKTRNATRSLLRGTRRRWRALIRAR